MAEATRESKNIVEYPVIPVVKPVTGKRGITPHILPGEKADSLFPFLRAVNKETILFIGSASSFFFAGTTGEFFKLRNQIEDTLKIQWMKTKARDGRTEPFLPFEKRSILSVYKRLSNDGIVVLLDGREQGPFWTREEFLEAYGNFLEDPRAHTFNR